MSVCMITYMHQDYIRQAIESVLMQQTNFDFELVISDDFSKDNTEEIVKSMISTHPKGKSITYIKQPKNLGVHKNFLFALKQCHSKYVALCEGDDYWTDPLKLQKQVDFLESNPEYEVCFTNIRIIDEHGGLVKQKLINDDRKSDYEIKDLPIWAPTLTRVFRNRDFSTIPNAPGLDTIMLLFQARYGKIKFIDDITGSYRLHEKGVYSSLSAAKKKEHIIITDIESLQFVEKPLRFKYIGMVFKKLLELKTLDKSLFIINRKRLLGQYKLYFFYFNVIEHLKIVISLFLIALPYLHRNSKAKEIQLKILNNLFIY